jgi:hypothetical protein
LSSWLDDISLALANLDGIAHYDTLYLEVKKIRSGALPKSWKQIIQRTIQDHSEDSDGFKGSNVFYSVNFTVLSFPNACRYDISYGKERGV